MRDLISLETLRYDPPLITRRSKWDSFRVPTLDFASNMLECPHLQALCSLRYLSKVPSLIKDRPYKLAVSFSKNSLLILKVKYNMRQPPEHFYSVQ